MQLLFEQEMINKLNLARGETVFMASLSLASRAAVNEDKTLYDHTLNLVPKGPRAPEFQIKFKV